MHTGSHPTSAPDRAAPIAEGEMRARIEAFDWGSTPLGPLERWPQSLKTALDICLTSRSPILLWWGPQLIELYNDAYRPVLGATKHPRALGAPGREIWPEIWDVIGPLLESVMERGESTWRENQFLILDRNGYPEETYFTYGYSPIRDESGRVGGVFSSVLEQTERVLSERRFRTLRDLAALASLARSREEACVRSAEVLSGARADIPFAALYLVDEGGREARLAGHTGVRPGSSVAPYTLPLDRQARGWPLADVVKSGRAQVVENLEALFGDLTDGPWEVAPHTAMVLPLAVSAQAEQATGAAGIFVAAVSARRALDDDYRGFLELAAGHIAACVAHAHAYENERRRAESLAALDRAKTEFFSNVSHEFRTPLTLMLGPIEDALRDERTVPANRERAKLVHRNALRLLKLVNTLLDFSRIEAGRMEASYVRTELGPFTAELASTFRSAIEKAGLRLDIDVDAPLCGDVYVDRDMWEKVVLNLLSNAFKHTFEGRIAVTLRPDGNHAVLEVADTGVGIAADHLDRIFERFHRIPSARSRTHEGTGIGLALVQEIVKLHGGDITVSSAEGSGTTFRVRVPCGTAHLPPDRIGAPRGSLSTASGPAAWVEEASRWVPDPDDAAGAIAAAAERSVRAETGRSRGLAGTAGRRILVADDNADMREYVTRLLRDAGWIVQPVNDGLAARDAALADPPDLVLSDIMMPGLDGMDLLDLLKRDDRTRDVPVILLSARAGEDARIAGITMGADDYLVKPFSARELIARADAQIALRLARRETERGLREDAQMTRTIERIGSSVTAQLSLDRIVQMVTDAATQLVGAQFGAFFYNNVNAAGETYVLYAISGVPREAFSKFPVPRNTPLFGPTFRGTGVVRSDDIHADARYGRNPPYHGMPPGHLPVVSYLAVPVISRTGAVLGGLFFGHERAAVFTEQHERLVVGIAGWAALAIDNARLYESERNARSEAERANMAKSDFLAAMSHELRTPLNAIQGHVQLLELGLHGPMQPAQLEALERVQKSQQHLLALINDVLNFAKIEAGRLEYDIDSFAIAPLVRETLDVMGTQFAAKSLTATAQIEGDAVVRADRDKVHQILLNLFSNAIKFTDQGGVTVTLGEGTPERVELRVADTGIGIPREKRESIFDPFVQVHRNLKRSDPGTGLGLSISRDLARGMGGDLRVEGRDPEGSVFILSLPRG